MLKDMTRTRLIQVWFVAVALFVVAGLAIGASVTVGTGVLLVAVGLVPPGIILMLWPGDTPTVAEVIHDAEGRK
jgi:hypothetical protein